MVSSMWRDPALAPSQMMIRASALAAISRLRIGPAALPLAFQSGWNQRTGMPRSAAHSAPIVSGPRAPPDNTSVIGKPASWRAW